MSTPNFALKNASRFFVFGTPVYYNQEDIDANEMEQNLLGEYDEECTEFNYQAAKDNVYYELKAKGWNAIDEYEKNRSYPTSFFSEKTKTIYIGDEYIDVTVKAGYTPGYYQAANFDWCAKVVFSGVMDYEADELTADDVIRDNWYNNMGLSKIHSEHIINKIASIIDALKNEAEYAFSMYCDEELFCTYHCFNGETGYSATGKRLWQEIEDKNKKTA